MTVAPVLRATWVPQSPIEAFRLFTDEIGAWWPLPSHGLFGHDAGGLIFEDRHLVEYATDGRRSTWGQVLTWEPGQRLVMTWHPGRDGDDASEVEVTFEADGEGTRVVLEHRGWEAFGADAMARRRSYVGPGAWGSVLDHFADRGEDRPDGADLTELAERYKEFFAVAEAGEFADPTDGGWHADQVIAHVTLNDAAMLAVCQSLIHQREAVFSNETCQRLEVLDAWIADCGDRATLIARGRSAAAQVVGVLSRLSEDQRKTEVHCRLAHDGELVLDAPRPWGALAIDTQADMHLPAHIEQLENLLP